MTATKDRIRPTHPVTEALLAHRAASLQLKAAYRITAFAGSMPFVHLHAAVFALWMICSRRAHGRR